MTRQSDGTLCEYTASGTVEYPEIKPTPLASLSTTPVIIEFDILEVNGRSSFQVTGKSSSNTNTYNGKQLETGHWKISIKENMIKIEIDGVVKSNPQPLDNVKWYSGFTLSSSWGNSSWKFANYVVYPLD